MAKKPQYSKGVIYALTHTKAGEKWADYITVPEKDLPLVFTPAQIAGRGARSYVTVGYAVKKALAADGYIVPDSARSWDCHRTDKPWTGPDLKPRRNGAPRKGSIWPWTLEQHWGIVQSNPFQKQIRIMRQLNVDVHIADLDSKSELQNSRNAVERALKGEDRWFPGRWLRSRAALIELCEIMLVWPTAVDGRWRMMPLDPEVVCERRTARLIMVPAREALRSLKSYDEEVT